MCLRHEYSIRNVVARCDDEIRLSACCRQGVQHRNWNCARGSPCASAQLMPDNEHWIPSERAYWLSNLFGIQNSILCIGLENRKGFVARSESFTANISGWADQITIRTLAIARNCARSFYLSAPRAVFYANTDAATRSHSVAEIPRRATAFHIRWSCRCIRQTKFQLMST